MMALVEYLIARDGLPPRRGAAYDYVLAGDGLFVATENPYLAARVPVAAATVRGLPPVYSAFTLQTGRLPGCLWKHIVAVAQIHSDTEVLLVVTYESSGYQLRLPAQVTGPLSVTYRPASDAVLEIHSHRHFPASFSATDNADEKGFRIYAVIGCLDSAHPEVALRVGVYGHFMPVPWEAVFDGNRTPFRDVNFDPPEEVSMEPSNDLPD